MPWYPEATKLEIPESSSQPSIVPTQVIFHSLAAPWTIQRTYEYWRDSTSLESHFAIDYTGAVGQYVNTSVRADANYGANKRPDGTGAISVETASRTDSTDPWNSAQVEAAADLILWAHKTHGVPLRMCRSHSDPGIGYHRQFPEWSVSGTACPGNKRIEQLIETVLPLAIEKSSPPEEEKMPLYVNLGSSETVVPFDSWTAINWDKEWNDEPDWHLDEGGPTFAFGPSRFTGTLYLSVTGLLPGEFLYVRQSDIKGGEYVQSHPITVIGAPLASVSLTGRLPSSTGARIKVRHTSNEEIRVSGVIKIQGWKEN